MRKIFYTSALLSSVLKNTRLRVIQLVLISGALATPVVGQHDPVQKFGGKIGKTLQETQQSWPVRKKAEPGAPNVVWVLLDDVGFGAISTFGGLIKTPTLDSLANNGLRYTNFHTTAICSPTRAALLTGRNSHSVHMGLFPNTAIGTPGYDGLMPFEKATVAEILKENGYNTYAVGKWHLTPLADASPAGPFNRFPTGRGFDHYFGFLGGSTDQYHPILWEDTKKVNEVAGGKHFNTLIADKAISYLKEQETVEADKPFFLYIAPGAGHAPHQVSKEWSDKYKGLFDAGWDKYREKVLTQQIRLGIVPKGTVLPERNPGLKAWDSLNADEKKLYVRFMEVYAGLVSQTDYELGRVFDFIKETGQLENTVVVVSVGDNGGSKEGTFVGVINNTDPLATEEERLKQNLGQIDLIGTEKSKPNYPLGWAAATNTPFRQWKQDANTEGGTRNPLIVFYPKAIKEKGGIRNQYSHLIDILPTTLELTGAKVPGEINGYKQGEIEGISLAYSINDGKAPSKRTVQHYEIMGTRSVYKDGWKAGTLHVKGEDFSQDKWELYNLNEDFNERNNVASKYPEKLKELQALFDVQAEKYNIYPLKDGTEKETKDPKRLYSSTSKIVLYPGTTNLFGLPGAIFPNTAYSITAEADNVTPESKGVLFASGGSQSGLSIFIKDGKVQVAENTGYKIVNLVSEKPLPAGKLKVKFDFNFQEPSDAKSNTAGTQALYVNDVKVAEAPIDKGIAAIRSTDEVHVGSDQVTPVSDLYSTPFAFNGKVNSVLIENR